MAQVLQMDLADVDARFAVEQQSERDLALCDGNWNALNGRGLAAMLDGTAAITPEAVRQAVHAWLVTPPPQTVELSAGRRIGHTSSDNRVQHLTGLLTPSGRSPAGYRQYHEVDLLR